MSASSASRRAASSSAHRRGTRHEFGTGCWGGRTAQLEAGGEFQGGIKLTTGQRAEAVLVGPQREEEEPTRLSAALVELSEAEGLGEVVVARLLADAPAHLCRLKGDARRARLRTHLWVYGADECVALGCRVGERRRDKELEGARIEAERDHRVAAEHGAQAQHVRV